MDRRFFPQLSRIAAVVRFAHGCRRGQITGFLDTPYKICACYLAQKCTTLDNHTIGRFFQIHPDFMQKKIESYSIDLLLDPEAKKVLTQMEELCFELELANAGIGHNR